MKIPQILTLIRDQYSKVDVSSYCKQLKSLQECILKAF